jgi:hypothetical protein
MAKDIIEKGLRPYITAALNIHRENINANEYTAYDKLSGEKILYSLNYFQPVISAGMGGLAFYNENGFKGSFDFDYTFRITVYNNDYSYVEDTSSGVNPNNYRYITKTINGSWGPASSTVNTPILRERSNIFNSVVPSVSGAWSSGNLGLKAKLRVNLDFDNTKTTDMDVRRDASGKTDGSLQKQGNDETKDTFTVIPRLDLGLQYKIIPDRLTLNAGGRLARSLTVTSTGVKVYDTNGNEDYTSSYNLKSTNFGTMTWRLYAGTMFNFTENVWLEAATGVQNGVNVFSTGADGLFNFTTFAIGLKY